MVQVVSTWMDRLWGRIVEHNLGVGKSPLLDEVDYNLARDSMPWPWHGHGCGHGHGHGHGMAMAMAMDPTLINGPLATAMGSWIQDPGSWIRDPGARLLDTGSWILDAGSWVEVHRSLW